MGAIAPVAPTASVRLVIFVHWGGNVWYGCHAVDWLSARPSRILDYSAAAAAAASYWASAAAARTAHVCLSVILRVS